jgi:hypothetical protein
VSNSANQISVRLDPDERLAAAVGGAARYMADAAGLATDVILQFQASVLSACRHCFRAHSAHTPCGVTLRRSPDRLEVEVALPGSETAATEKRSWDGIDEVHLESRYDAAVLRLTKYVPPSPPPD